MHNTASSFIRDHACCRYMLVLTGVCHQYQHGGSSCCASFPDQSQVPSGNLESSRPISTACLDGMYLTKLGKHRAVSVCMRMPLGRACEALVPCSNPSARGNHIRASLETSSEGMIRDFGGRSSPCRASQPQLPAGST